MSDENEGPPPLSPELHEFFEEHAKTGEPTQAELGRALLRLHGATRPTMFSVAGRRWLPPEVLAVAAVLVLSVGGAFIGWRVRTANAQTEAMSTAKAAWVRGDLEAASAAFEACSTAECARLAAAVKRAKLQSANLDGLDEAETGSLLALDQELSAGERSVLAERLEKKPVESAEAFATKQISVLLAEGHDQSTVNVAIEAFTRGAAVGTPPEEARRALELVVSLVPSTDLSRAAEAQLVMFPAAEPVAAPVVESPYPPELRDLLDEAKAAKKERRYEDAIRLMTRCLNQFRDQPDCVVVQASVFAMRGNDTSSQADNIRAKALYERFLRVADPDDKRVVRVREILSSSPTPGDSPSSKSANVQAAEDAFQRGYMLLDRDPDGARRLFTEALALSDPGSSTSAKARAQLERLPGKDAVRPAWVGDRVHDLYLRGYQLRETEPDVARRLFQQVIDIAPGSIDAQKAQNRLDAMNQEEAVAAEAVETAPPPSQAITLKAGERLRLTVKDLERVAIGDAAIADVISSGGDVVEVVAVKAGVTTLVTWRSGQRRTWRVTVTGSVGRMGQLKIASYPTNANVIIDRNETGRRTPVLPSQPLVVPVGRHTIQFELNGKQSAVQTIDVVEGANPVIKGEIPQ